MGSPSKVRSRPADHMQVRTFFDKPNGFPVLRRYILSYASIATIYLCKIDKITFYFIKKCPSACICAIFVVPLQAISSSGGKFYD